MRCGVRLWVPGVACLFGGLAGRVVLGRNGFPEGRLGLVRSAAWQLFWYGLGWLLIACHLSPRDGPGASWGRWALWWVGVLASGLAVLSSCPP